MNRAIRFGWLSCAIGAILVFAIVSKAAAPPAVRLGAARSILEIGIKLREAADLEERLSALEQQLGVADACRP